MLIYLLNTTNGNSWSNNLDIVGQFFQIIFSLVLIIFLMIAFVKLFSRSSYKRGRYSNMRVVETIGVGYQSVVQLLQAGNKFFLIGVTKERITLLAEIDESSIDTTEPEKIQFDKYLNRFLKKDEQTDE